MKKFIEIFAWVLIVIFFAITVYMMYDVFATAYKIMVLDDTTYDIPSVFRTWAGYVLFAACCAGFLKAFITTFLGVSRKKMERELSNIIMWPVAPFYFIFHFIFHFILVYYNDRKEDTG